MKILKYPLIIFLGLTLLYTGLKSITIKPVISGKVFDSVSKNPLKNISLVRETNLINNFCFNINGPECRGTLRVDIVTTDENGMFNFPAYWKFKSLTEEVEENFHINSYGFSNESKLVTINQNYFNYLNYFYNRTFSDSSFQISIAPIVTDLDKCIEDSECIKQNRKWGRICFDRDTEFDKKIASDQYEFCKSFHARGGKLFDDTSNDLVVCNKEISDAKAVECVSRLSLEQEEAILDENSCSRLNNELAKNYCYLIVALNPRHPSLELCNKITTKSIPEFTYPYLPSFITDLRETKGSQDYRVLCLSQYKDNF